MFASTLAQLREQSGLSQQDVADKLHIARATYINLESGKKSPSLDELKKLADIFEVGVEALISDKKISEPLVPDLVELNDDEEEIQPREVPTESLDKLREVLLYVIEKVGAKPNVGETVIYKLLYFIDFDYYEKFGKSITGITYVRNHYGPTPKLQTFNGLVNAMKEKGQLEVVETSYFKHLQKKYLPVVESSLSKVSGHELAHIDEVLGRLSDKSARELSDYSHRDTPWIATKAGEEIDYQLAMYRTAETSVKESEDEL